MQAAGAQTQIQQAQQQPVPQAQAKADSKQAHTREIEMIVQEEREAKGKMPIYKGLERFKLLDKMGESVPSSLPHGAS